MWFPTLRFERGLGGRNEGVRLRGWPNCTVINVTSSHQIPPENRIDEKGARSINEALQSNSTLRTLILKCMYHHAFTKMLWR